MWRTARCEESNWKCKKICETEEKAKEEEDSDKTLLNFLIDRSQIEEQINVLNGKIAAASEE